MDNSLLRNELETLTRGKAISEKRCLEMIALVAEKESLTEEVQQRLNAVLEEKENGPGLSQMIGRMVMNQTQRWEFT